VDSLDIGARTAPLSRQAQCRMDLQQASVVVTPEHLDPTGNAIDVDNLVIGPPIARMPEVRAMVQSLPPAGAVAAAVVGKEDEARGLELLQIHIEWPD